MNLNENDNTHMKRSSGEGRRREKTPALKQEFYTQLIYLFLLCVILVLALILKPGDPDYDKLQGALAIIVLLIALTYILAPSYHRGMAVAISKCFHAPQLLSLEDVTSLLYVGMYLIGIAMICVADWSNVFNTGLRIGTVVTITLVRALRMRIIANKKIRNIP
jgi:hypothetical protein